MFRQIWNQYGTNWSKIGSLLEYTPQICSKNRLLQNNLEPTFVCQSRNTFIVKRKKQMKLFEKGFTTPSLRKNDYIYELIDHEGARKAEYIDVILTTYVPGLGQKGELVKVKKNYGYSQLLAPKLADYASPENIEYWKKFGSQETEKDTFSSKHVERTMGYISKRVVCIVMNKDIPWTIEPWHVRVSLRKAGIHANEDCIELPKETISGPNIDIEGKEFNIILTINKKEKLTVRCKIHHWSTDPLNRLPYVQDFWLLPGEKIFPEEVKESAA